VLQVLRRCLQSFIGRVTPQLGARIRALVRAGRGVDSGGYDGCGNCSCTDVRQELTSVCLHGARILYAFEVGRKDLDADDADER